MPRKPKPPINRMEIKNICTNYDTSPALNTRAKNPIYTDTQSNRHRDTQTQPQTGRQTDRQADRHTDTHTQTDRQTHRHTQTQTDTQTHTQTDRSI